MTPAQIEEAADEDNNGDEISSATEATSRSDNALLPSQHVGDASREASSHPPDDGRVSRNASDSNVDDDLMDDADVGEVGTRLDTLKAAQDESMGQALSDDHPISPGQASGDTAMTEMSTQS